MLATNTSSLPVTAVAAGAKDPARVVGMHFFNPAPVMKLVEVIAGDDSADDALELVRDVGRRMGREVIDAADGPGFLVNRCNRPFGLEGARIVTERLAPVEDVDRICRLGGGFRMGPFELMDLVGVDTGLAVSKSFAELSFGEPRWRPSPLVARLVAAGRHGRKTGRGWYEYAEDGSYRDEDPEAPEVGGGEARLVVVTGEVEVVGALAERAAEAGFDVRSPEDAEGEVPWLILDGGEEPEGPPAQGGPRAVLCAQGALAELDAGGGAAGFHLFATPEQGGRLVELTRSDGTAEAAAARVEELVSACGLHHAWVGDAPGLVLGRIVAQVINEACFALGEGVGSAADIDTGMRLGLNWPRGPFAWAETIGLEHVAMVLEGLWDFYREERYRPAPELRRALLAGRESFLD